MLFSPIYNNDINYICMRKQQGLYQNKLNSSFVLISTCYSKMGYRKIPKSLGAFIRRGLSTEGDLRFKIDWASFYIVGSKLTVFALFYFIFEGKFPSTSPRGAYIQRGDLTEGFLRYWIGGLIFGGAYTWRGLFTEFYVNARRYSSNVDNERPQLKHRQRSGRRRRFEPRKISLPVGVVVPFRRRCLRSPFFLELNAKRLIEVQENKRRRSVSLPKLLKL